MQGQTAAGLIGWQGGGNIVLACDVPPPARQMIRLLLILLLPLVVVGGGVPSSWQGLNGIRNQLQQPQLSCPRMPASARIDTTTCSAAHPVKINWVFTC